MAAATAFIAGLFIGGFVVALSISIVMVGKKECCTGNIKDTESEEPDYKKEVEDQLG